MTTTSKHPNRQADLNNTRAAFMQRASAPNIPPHAFKLAYLLAFKYMNRRTASAHPAQATLARDLNVSVRTVQRLLDILEPLGLTIVPGDGRGKASSYAIDPERVTRVSSFPAGKGDKKGRHPTPKKGDTGVAPTLLREPRLTGVPKGTPCERERVVLAHDFDSGGGAAPLTGAPAEKESPTPPPRQDTNDAFAELQAAWPRPWPDDLGAARSAFATACREVTPATIIAAAKTWAGAADAPRFLPALAKWLDARGWERDPPQRKRCGPAKKRNGRAPKKFDMAAYALELGGYVEGEDGAMVWGGAQ